MSEYINIISKEVVSRPLQWPVVLVGCLAIASIIGILIWLLFTKNENKKEKSCFLLGITGAVGLGLLLTVSIICSIFFPEPTARYRYKATVDLEKISVSEYEAFIEEYNPIIKDEIYYFEKELSDVSDNG